MSSSNQAQTKAKRNEFMDLLSKYMTAEIGYHMADAAKASGTKDCFSWQRNAAYKAILEFVFPAKEETETEAAPADQQPTESPADNTLLPSFFRKRTMNSTTGLDELKMANTFFKEFAKLHLANGCHESTLYYAQLSNQMERGIAALEMLIHQHGNYKFAFEQWHEKTQWVQDTCESHELGKHRADVLKDRIDSLTQQLKTRECKCKCNHVPFNIWFTEELAKKASKKASKGANT